MLDGFPIGSHSRGVDISSDAGTDDEDEDLRLLLPQRPPLAQPTDIAELGARLDAVHAHSSFPDTDPETDAAAPPSAQRPDPPVTPRPCTIPSPHPAGSKDLSPALQQPHVGSAPAAEHGSPSPLADRAALGNSVVEDAILSALAQQLGEFDLDPSEVADTPAAPAAPDPSPLSRTVASEAIAGALSKLFGEHDDAPPAAAPPAPDSADSHNLPDPTPDGAAAPSARASPSAHAADRDDDSCSCIKPDALSPRSKNTPAAATSDEPSDNARPLQGAPPAAGDPVPTTRTAQTTPQGPPHGAAAQRPSGHHSGEEARGDVATRCDSHAAPRGASQCSPPDTPPPPAAEACARATPSSPPRGTPVAQTARGRPCEETTRAVATRSESPAAPPAAATPPLPDAPSPPPAANAPATPSAPAGGEGGGRNGRSGGAQPSQGVPAS